MRLTDLGRARAAKTHRLQQDLIRHAAAVIDNRNPAVRTSPLRRDLYLMCARADAIINQIRQGGWQVIVKGAQAEDTCGGRGGQLLFGHPGVMPRPTPSRHLKAYFSYKIIPGAPP
jgi:hypothetical protein